MQLLALRNRMIVLGESVLAERKIVTTINAVSFLQRKHPHNGFELVQLILKDQQRVKIL
jgi:hypothetical protein